MKLGCNALSTLERLIGSNLSSTSGETVRVPNFILHPTRYDCRTLMHLI